MPCVASVVVMTMDVRKAFSFFYAHKTYTINIVYFSMVKSKDYVYHGKIVFRSLHDSNNFLKLSARQQELFIGKDAGDIFSEYYVLRVNDFDKVAKTPLDEWIKKLF